MTKVTSFPFEFGRASMKSKLMLAQGIPGIGKGCSNPALFYKERFIT
jgi:hypothetical protein